MKPFVVILVFKTPQDAYGATATIGPLISDSFFHYDYHFMFID